MPFSKTVESWWEGGWANWMKLIRKERWRWWRWNNPWLEKKKRQLRSWHLKLEDTVPFWYGWFDIYPKGIVLVGPLSTYCFSLLYFSKPSSLFIWLSGFQFSGLASLSHAHSPVPLHPFKCLSNFWKGNYYFDFLRNLWLWPNWTLKNGQVKIWSSKPW